MRKQRLIISFLADEKAFFGSQKYQVAYTTHACTLLEIFDGKAIEQLN
jgi:hypothetical protein